MSYLIYESHNGDMIKFEYDEDIPFMGGKSYYSNVKYYAKRPYQKDYWLAICANGKIIKVEPKKAKPLLDEGKIMKVGNCKFHNDLSRVIMDAQMFTKRDNTKEVMEVIKNRKRCFWTKEYRGA